MKKIIIAIDGYSSCGKSTMAKSLASKIGYIYFDSGAMYRAVALYSLEQGLISDNGEIDTVRLKELMPKIEIRFRVDSNTQKSVTYLNAKNIENEIRGLRVSNIVSQVAALDFVRSALIEQQREMGVNKGIVMDGRDIGTTVFPDAELKVYVTASAEVRAKRRYDELVKKGESPDYNEILKDVTHRDFLDKNRKISPLKQAEDAIALNNSNLTSDEQLNWLYEQYIQHTAKM